MGEYAIKMPDIGEGIAEAELVEWLVAVGDEVALDAPLAEVMTDKARVQIPSPVAGTVLRLGAEPGESVAVGGELIRLTVAGRGNVSEPQPGASEGSERRAKAPGSGSARPEPAPSPRPPVRRPAPAKSGDGDGKVLAAPAVRARARDEGVDLRDVPGTGPDRRVTAADLAAYLEGPAGTSRVRAAADRDAVEEMPVTGIRRITARRLQEAWTQVPHITIVEESDVTELEALRTKLNAGHHKLTVLPFLIRAMVRAVADQPELNAHFEGEVIRRYAAVHVGIATQAPDGLKVPVLRHAESLDLWQSAKGIEEVSAAARDGRARREDLTGSTITVTSLGKLGGIATTPIINPPEVAIVGVNRMVVRPLWDGSSFVPRTVMNLSCSFDHRVIDGWAAATFVARLKELLETPALMFVP